MAENIDAPSEAPVHRWLELQTGEDGWKSGPNTTPADLPRSSAASLPSKIWSPLNSEASQLQPDIQTPESQKQIHHQPKTQTESQIRENERCHPDKYMEMIK